MNNKISRRDMLKLGATAAAAASTVAAPAFLRKSRAQDKQEYVWLSAFTNLPLFVANDHPALFQIGKELDVTVTIAGPNTVDIPGLVAAVEQTTARRPSGMMVVGWDPSALIPAIDAAIDAGIPVVTVDADVPASKRLSFIGTDWFSLGVAQGRAMLAALGDRKGIVATQGYPEQEINQQALRGFRSVLEPAGLTVLDEVRDGGNVAETTQTAANIITANPDLVGMAGFNSESGPGIGAALKEAGKGGQIVATCVDAELQHLTLVKEGILTACVGQKRQLFTYQGVRALHDVVNNKLAFTGSVDTDKQVGIVPIPINYNTGTYTVTAATVDIYIKAKGG
jgi:ABC-type sugar transport system substrate-binding protein